MKKFITFAMIFMLCVSFSGCANKSEIENLSTNLTTYNMTIDFNNEEKTLTATSFVDYYNASEDVLTELYFHLYPNAFREDASASVVSLSNSVKAYPNGKSYGNIKISKCKVQNNVVEYTIGGEDQNILITNLGFQLYPKNRATIEIDFTVTLPNINHRFGYGENTINLGNFYPIACIYENGKFVTDLYHYNGDPFYSDVANYNVTISYDKNLTLATTGNIAETTENEGIKTTKSSAITVRDFAMVLSDKFKTVERKVNQTNVIYYYYGDENPNQSLKTACDSVSSFNKLFGEYPYESLSVVESNFVHGGMEYPRLILISDDIEDYDDYLNVIIHETAHQWWYGIVGNNEYQYGWLDEGLTEYSTAVFYQNNEGYNRTYEDIMKNANANYSLYVEVYKSVYKTVDTSMNRKLNEYNTEPEYVYIAYVKGMLLFDNVREVLGDNKFFKGLKQYFENGKFKNNTPDNLIQSFEEATNTNLKNLFDSWINGNVLIEKVA